MIANEHSTYTNQPTPTRLLMMQYGLLIVGQFRALGIVVPAVPLAPPGEVNQSWLRALDLRAGWSYSIREQVVGFFQDSSGVFHGFLKDDSSFTTIGVPGSLGTFPYDINDREEIVGKYEDAAGASHGFMESHGRFSTVDVPGGVALKPPFTPSGPTFIYIFEAAAEGEARIRIPVVNGLADNPEITRMSDIVLFIDSSPGLFGKATGSLRADAKSRFSFAQSHRPVGPSVQPQIAAAYLDGIVARYARSPDSSNLSGVQSDV